MDYEKKYKEILEWARKNKAILNGVPIEEVLPELRECEDERIRKWLVTHFRQLSCQEVGGIAVNDILAWLEKQKDAITDVTMTEAYKMGLEAGRAQEEAEKFFDSAQSYHDGFIAGQKQKEQKPISSCDIVPYIDDKIAALQDMWREEKVAFDWDDMHEMIEDVARHFYQKEQKQDSLIYDEDLDHAAREFYLSGKADSLVDSTGLVPIVRMAEFGATWMKKKMEKEQKPSDMPPGFYFIDLDGKKYYSKEFRYGDMKMKVVENEKEQKPAEWSEEDEKMLNNILAELGNHIVYNNAPNGMPSGTGWSSYKYKKEIDWLKSLRSHWKPSEEQMKALQWWSELPSCSPGLKSLYEDLKKLK